MATVAAVAPLLGLLIAVNGIEGSFVACGGEKWACMAAMVDRLSNAIARGALGLLIGIVALLFYRYLRSRLDDFNTEMRCTILELANALAKFP